MCGKKHQFHYSFNRCGAEYYIHLTKKVSLRFVVMSADQNVAKMPTNLQFSWRTLNMEYEEATYRLNPTYTNVAAGA